MQITRYKCDWSGCTVESDRPMGGLRVVTSGSLIDGEMPRYSHVQAQLTSQFGACSHTVRVVHLCNAHLGEIRGTIPVTAIHEAIRGGV